MSISRTIFNWIGEPKPSSVFATNPPARLHRAANIVLANDPPPDSAAGFLVSNYKISSGSCSACIRLVAPPREGVGSSAVREWDEDAEAE